MFCRVLKIDTNGYGFGPNVGDPGYAGPGDRIITIADARATRGTALLTSWVRSSVCPARPRDRLTDRDRPRHTETDTPRQTDRVRQTETDRPRQTDRDRQTEIDRPRQTIDVARVFVRVSCSTETD